MNNNKQTILITGANGQLGNEIKNIASGNSTFHFLFTDKQALPIEEYDAVNNYFDQHQIHFCINCAAYTSVDKAESEKEKAFLINSTAAGNLATACSRHGTSLIHISTDYVFDGTTSQPYKETDDPNPIGIYGNSKLKGEVLLLKNNPSSIIIRTSWLYSSFGNNFVKTMLHLLKEKEIINVVNDQFGCPTYAADLAEVIMSIIQKWPLRNSQYPLNKQSALFNYCNKGKISWFEFALAIKELTGSKCVVNPIPSSQYLTAAKRPSYSVLDTSLIQTTFSIAIPEWRESLKKCLAALPTPLLYIRAIE